MTKSRREKYVSSGKGTNVNKKILNAVRRQTTPLERINRQVAAWRKGGNVVLTIPNPNPHETNKPYIRRNAKDVWGTPKSYMIKSDSRSET
jgi:hypothetical protein